MSNSKKLLFVISAPSGAGKSTLVGAILKRVPNTRRSVSHTTRPPRQYEVEGEDYYFVSPETFQQMQEHDEFLEWAEVHGNLYGTSKREIEDIFADGYDAILDIDVQGAAQLRKTSPEAVMIFILPPSFEVLKQRLTARGTESSSDLKRRLRGAQVEVRQYTEFDYVVVNDEREEAGAAVEAIVLAERHAINPEETRVAAQVMARAERYRRDRMEERTKDIIATFKEK
jgi:guanylate kinase